MTETDEYFDKWTTALRRIRELEDEVERLREELAERMAIEAMRVPFIERACPKCDGCGKVADTENEEPWSQWLDIPLGSSAAVLSGVVRPKTCPSCGGRESKEGADDRD